MVSLPFFLASTLLGAGVGASKFTAFLPPARLGPVIRTNENRVGALGENGEGGIIVDTFLSSLPSPDDVKENFLEVRGMYDTGTKIPRCTIISSLTRMQLADFYYV